MVLLVVAGVVAAELLLLLQLDPLQCKQLNVVAVVVVVVVVVAVPVFHMQG